MTEKSDIRKMVEDFRAEVKEVQAFALEVVEEVRRVRVSVEHLQDRVHRLVNRSIVVHEELLHRIEGPPPPAEVSEGNP